MSEIFWEWYVYEEVGIGLRSIILAVSDIDTIVGNSGDKGTEVKNFIFTLNWIPFGSSEYTRMGLMAGVGHSEYETTETEFFPRTTTRRSATGTATLFGVYVDWGGEFFGARHGANYLSTDIGDINGATVDGSGTMLYFDLRWAF